MYRWLWIGSSLLLAQKIVSRSQIEVQGYSVEKVGLPQSPAYAGKGRFAFIEYWATGKPKAGYYVECLNTDYYTQWSQLLDLPPAGQGKPLRLIGMRDALVALSYEEDPLNRGVIQEAARFYDLKGQPILPKWTHLSVYDRPASGAVSQISLSPDSTFLLWYAYTADKKGQVQTGWYALWSSSGRKVASQTDWSLTGPVVAARPDNRMNLWTLQTPPGRLPELVYYDTKARTRRNWILALDTALYAPWLYVTPKAIYVGGLLPGEKNLSTEYSSAGAWALGKLSLPLTDTSQILWSRSPFPAEWTSLYKEPIAPTAVRFFPQGDTILYTLWEDLRTRGGTFMAYDIWAVRWAVADTPALRWSYRIEKRQREPSLDAVSFLAGITETFLEVAFLTERTGKGKLRVYLFNHQTGEAITKDIADNTAGDLYLLPGRAAHIGPREVICLALAAPGKNGYQIYHIRF